MTHHSTPPAPIGSVLRDYRLANFRHERRLLRQGYAIFACAKCSAPRPEGQALCLRCERRGK